MEGIKFVTYDFLHKEAGTFVCEHGANTFGVDMVAIVEGRLCPEEKCGWCDNVWRRIQSRTGGRPA